MKNLFLTKTRWLVTIILLTALGSGNAWGAIADGTYALCTSTSDLEAGAHYIIASGTSGSVYCISNVSQTNYRERVSATVSNDKITVASNSTIMTFTLGGSTDAWTFYTDNYAGTAGYLASAASGSNNYCRVLTNSTTGTISISNSVATIALKPHSTRKYLKYNSGSSRFACYSSGQADVYLYKLAPSCTTIPTVTAASNSSVTATTATVSCSDGIEVLGSDGCSISSYGFVIGKSSNPEIGGSGVTQHEVGTTYTSTGVSFSKDLTGLTAETTYYVRPYATNGKGTAYGTQTSFTTSALPKYTVTLKDDGDKRTQASAGASVTLPVRAGCAGYTFAGWTKTWVAPQSSWTTTAPTIIPAGSYTPTANENLYPVYTKTEGGGGPTTESYGFEEESPTNWTIGSQPSRSNSNAHSGSYAGYINTNHTYVTFKEKVKVTAFSFWLKRTSTNSNYNVYIETSTNGTDWSAAATYKMSDFGNGTYTQKEMTWDGSTAYYVRFHCYNTTATRYVDDISITYSGGSTTSYISVPNCCTPLGTINGSF